MRFELYLGLFTAVFMAASVLGNTMGNVAKSDFNHGLPCAFKHVGIKRSVKLTPRNLSKRRSGTDASGPGESSGSPHF
ncbi:hypothetical protein BD408DRAFT_426862 [Parasitella parasitica]|nr:hypothetical protein BD408DRAFT_426862 [Parasitella parasitica]